MNDQAPRCDEMLQVWHNARRLRWTWKGQGLGAPGAITGAVINDAHIATIVERDSLDAFTRRGYAASWVSMLKAIDNDLWTLPLFGLHLVT